VHKLFTIILNFTTITTAGRDTKKLNNKRLETQLKDAPTSGSAAVPLLRC
jgi:hypothetical protein